MGQFQKVKQTRPVKKNKNKCQRRKEWTNNDLTRMWFCKQMIPQNEFKYYSKYSNYSKAGHNRDSNGIGITRKLAQIHSNSYDLCHEKFVQTGQIEQDLEHPFICGRFLCSNDVTRDNI